ncbi:Nitronate monooxygenase [Candidatus Hepatincola sp. Av]
MESKNSLLNLKYNIIQAPMAGGIVNPLLVATVCNAGMLGSIPAGYLSLELLQKFIKETKSLTKEPFMVNLFIEKPRKKEQVFKKANPIITIEQSLKNTQTNKNFTVPPTVLEKDYINLLVKEKIPIVSTTFGFLNKSSIKYLKENNIKIIGTATSYEEFTYLVDNGSDAVILQGFEAGGHQGSFLPTKPNNATTLELLNSIRKIDKKTIIVAAGGIAINNMVDFFKAGANYIQLGTAFMMVAESNLPTNIKEYIINKKITAISKNITGRYARGIQNKLIKIINDCNKNEIYEFPIQHFHTSQLRELARQNLNLEYTSVWAGSNQDNLKIQPINNLILSLQNKYKTI